MLGRVMLRIALLFCCLAALAFAPGGCNPVHAAPAIMADASADNATTIKGVWYVSASVGITDQCDSSTTGSLAWVVNRVGSSAATIALPTGAYACGTDLTIPDNVTVRFDHGAIITVASGKTLTVDGGIQAGQYQIFAATGDVDLGDANVEKVPVQWFGATGDGVTDDTDAIQDTLDATLYPYFPEPDVHYAVSGNLQTRNCMILTGPNRWQGRALWTEDPTGIIGDGTAPLFLTSTYPGGDVTTHRSITFRGMHMENTGHSCIQFYSAPNFEVFDCWLKVNDAGNAIESRYSWRGWIQRNHIVTDEGFGVSLVDNGNGVVISENNFGTNTSETESGAIDVAQSQAVIIRDNIIESVGGYGIRVGGFTGVGKGSSYGTVVSGNYIENTRIPYSFGIESIVIAPTITGGYVGNSNATMVTPYTFEIGRVERATIENISVWREPDESDPVVRFFYTAGGGIAQHFNDSTIRHVAVTNGLGDYYDFDAAVTSTIKFYILGRNVMKWEEDEPATGEPKVYISKLLEAGTNYPSANSVAIIPPTTYGGRIDAIHILEAQGTLGCTLEVGTWLDVDEYLSLDPSTLTYSDGGWAEATGVVKFLRAEYPAVLRVTAGAGTGSFRVRVDYRQ